MEKKTLITGIAHLGIRVHDLSRSRKFYGLLGFEFVVGPVGPEPVAILKHPAGVEINLILNAAESSQDNVLMDIKTKHAGYTHVALAVRDVDTAKSLLEDAGIPISGTERLSQRRTRTFCSRSRSQRRRTLSTR